RLLCERSTPEVRGKLQKLVLDEKEPRKARMHALWSLNGMGALDVEFHKTLLTHKDAGIRAWAVRAAGNAGKVSPAIRDRVVSLTTDRSPDVQLQVAIAARKIDGMQPLPLLLAALSLCGEDKLIPVIVWQNLHPLLEEKSGELVQQLEKAD